MSYGLYDGDLRLYPQVPFFNLELMKLATYYKRKREIVVFSPEFKPNMYSHFLVRQDYPSNFIYPTYSHVEYGGRAFDGNTYQPLSLDVERCHPDITIYDKVKIPRLNQRLIKQSLNTMRRAEHVRFSLDSKTIWKDWEKQLRKDSNVYGLILHDYNPGEIEGLYEFLKENLNQIIAHASGGRIGMKFPVVTTTEEDFLNWFSLPGLEIYFYLEYNGIFSSQIREPLQEIYVANRSKQISINPTANITYEDFITTGIIDLFKSLLDLRRCGIVFPLTYDKGFFADSRWAEVMELIYQFNNSALSKKYDNDYFTRQVPYQTLYSYMKWFVSTEHKYGYTTRRKDRANRIFQFVRENNYELFKMFYEYTGEL